MDLWSVQMKSNNFLLRNSILEKPIALNSKNSAMAFEIRVSRRKSFSDSYKYRSVVVNAMGKKNNGNANSSGNGDQSKPGGDNLKGGSPDNNTSNSFNSKKSHKNLDWREFRASLYIQEQAETLVSDTLKQDKETPLPKSLPIKWAHPISAPENGCLLVATEKLDGVRTFERTVVLILRSGMRNPLEGPFGVVINRSLHKRMKHMNPTNIDLATTFADCSLHFGGPLESSMFLLRSPETTGLNGFEEVIPGMCFGSRNKLDAASALVKKGILGPRDFRFFVGYAGWQLDQLRDEIESGYWHVAACSANLIFGSSENSSPDSLWEEILQLMGGHYSELSRKPKQDL